MIGIMNSRFGSTISLVVITLSSFLVVTSVPAQQGNEDLQLVPLPPQRIFPPQGYSIYPSPDATKQATRIISSGDDYEEFEAAAYVRTPTGRLFLTADNLDRHRRGSAAEWLYIPTMSDLPEFRLPAYLEGAPVESEEATSTRFDNHEFAAALPSLLHHFEAFKNGEDWTGGATRDTYNHLFTIGWSFANLGDFAQAETALESYARIAEIHWGGPFDRRGGLVPQGNLAEFYRSVGNLAKEKRIRQQAFEVHYQWEEGVVITDGFQFALAKLKEDVVDFAGNEQIESFQMFLSLVRIAVQHGSDEEARRLVDELQSVLKCIDVSFSDTCADHYNEGMEVIAEWELRREDPDSALKIIAKIANDYSRRYGNDVSMYPKFQSDLQARALLESGQAGKAIDQLAGNLDARGFTEALPARQLLLAAYFDGGRLDEARRLTDELETLQVERTRQVLAFSSEEQRIRFMRQLHPMMGRLALDDAEGAARVALRFKGLILDASMEEAASRLRSTSPETRRLQNELEKTKQVAHVALRLLEGDGKEINRSEMETLYRKAVNEVDRIEGLLARQIDSAGLILDALQREPGQIVRALGPDRCVFDFVQVDRHVGRNHFETLYVGFRYNMGGVEMRICGKVTEINARITTLRKKITSSGTDDASLRQDLESLENQLFGSWLDALAPDTTVLISPDGELNFLPFAALMNRQGTTLLERFEIGYITSARDAATPIQPWQVHNALLVGNPDYNQASQNPAPLGIPGLDRSLTLRASALGKIYFRPLPGAANEVQALQLTLKEKGVTTRLLMDGAATEDAFRSDSRVDLIHVATHGGILPDARPDARPDDGEDLVLGQMSSGILALAGANLTVKAWSHGEVIDPQADGIISADEFARMDLGGVRTMIMSACETGLGASQPGEGVMGLRRGLHQAGISQLVTTLWPINDAATVEVMKRLYERSLDGAESPLRALTMTQREFLREWSGGNGLAKTVNRVAPFIISLSQGRGERREDSLVEDSGRPNTPLVGSPKMELTPPASSADSSVSGSDSVERFVLGKLSAETAQDVDLITAFYAPSVNYFKDGQLSREEIKAKKRSYFDRFPDTSESLIGQVKVEREDGNWVARFQSNFRAASRTGDLEFEGVQSSVLLIDGSGGALQILSEDNEIISGNRKKNGVVNKILGSRVMNTGNTGETPSFAGEKYPETRLRALTEEDISEWSYGQVRYAINEMFARYGAIFADSKIQAVFDRLPWYQRHEERSFDEIESNFFSRQEWENLQILGRQRDRVKP